MLNKLRNKIIVSYLVLISLVMVLTSFFLLNSLEKYYLEYQSEALLRAARLTAVFASGSLLTVPDVVRISDLAENLARQIGARVIITDQRQRVVGDSERVGGLVGTVLDRPETAAALAGEDGQSIQYSQQSNQWVMQVAVPIWEEDRILGTVFISSSLSHIYRLLAGVRLFLQTATILSLVLAGVIGVLFAHTITVPIKLLTEATERMAKGDLSQRVEVTSSDEIGRLARQFNIMAGKLQESTRQLREFVANASHELRTPLTSLNILIKSLRDYPLEGQEREEFLDDIDNELERLIRLVEDLLDLTRLDRLANEDTMQITNVVPVVNNTLVMMKQRAEQKGLTLTYNLPEEPVTALVVVHQVKQVIFNLVDNAIKYTPEGGRINVRLYQQNDMMYIAVSDTGVGIPPEHREKVFERFYRVDKARSREQGGTGLGLAIVKEIVQHHGGRVWIEDNDGGPGVTAMVAIPLADSLLVK